MQITQTTQSILHRHRRPHQARRTGIGAEFTLPGEPGDDDAGQDAEYHFADHAGHHVADTGATAFAVVATQEGIDQVTDDAGNEDDEGVNHP